MNQSCSLESDYSSLSGNEQWPAALEYTRQRFLSQDHSSEIIVASRRSYSCHSEPTVRVRGQHQGPGTDTTDKSTMLSLLTDFG
jgi:hypothetical protein